LSSGTCDDGGATPCVDHWSRSTLDLPVAWSAQKQLLGIG
jgi:hypothetical protein